MLRFESIPGSHSGTKFHVHEFQGSELHEMASKWFSHVWVGGLKAQGPMYDVEVQRVSRAKAQAKRLTKAVERRARIATLVKAVVPVRWLDFVRSSLIGVGAPEASLTTHSSTRLDPYEVAKHSTSDFFLDEAQIERSIDLVALCSDSVNSEALERFRKAGEHKREATPDEMTQSLGTLNS